MHYHGARCSVSGRLARYPRKVTNWQLPEQYFICFREKAGDSTALWSYVFAVWTKGCAMAGSCTVELLTDVFVQRMLECSTHAKYALHVFLTTTPSPVCFFAVNARAWFVPPAHVWGLRPEVASIQRISRISVASGCFKSSLSGSPWNAVLK